MPSAGTVSTTDVAVSVRDAVKSFGTGASAVTALRGVSLEMQRGERVVLLGKSGSGKSTLLNLLGGLDRPTSGTVTANGRELSRMSRGEISAYRGTTVGFVFQSFNLVANRTAQQNVELPLVFAGRTPRERAAAAAQALEEVGLGHRRDHRPAELSGGEQQRVAIARALINNPPLLLADEPTGNLDTETSAAILEVLETHIERRGATVLLVTHDDDLAERFADLVIRMQDGQIVEEAS